MTFQRCPECASTVCETHGCRQDGGDVPLDVPCFSCGGEGEIIESVGFDPRDGQVIERGYRCTECQGVGGILIYGDPITMGDLDAAAP